MSSTTEQKPEILIIGGGIGGLTLGHALLQHDIPFRIFEREEASSRRAQGYRIRISGEGVMALQKCLSEDTFNILKATSSIQHIGFTKLDALTGEELKFDGPGPGPRPGMKDGPKPICVDRTVMRQVLISGLEGFIEYGKSFQHYKITDSGITAFFADGSSYIADFLVGADGIHSKVRRQFLPELKLVDTNGRCIYGKSYITEELTEAINPKAQSNMTIIQQHLPDGTPVTLFLEPTRFPDHQFLRKEGIKDYIYWVILSQSHTFGLSTTKLLQSSSEQAAELSEEVTKGWHRSLKPIISQQSKTSAAALQILSVHPDIPAWLPSARVTILGDAAHPMPPTAGLGALSALRDVAGLVDAIASGITEKSIGKYESEMRDWAGPAVRSSQKPGEMFFGQAKWENAKPVDS
jgi:2-polyprenyl-6-methoxyphenol hydroxylase-like FAD-dependent oxidoreductase